MPSTFSPSHHKGTCQNLRCFRDLWCRKVYITCHIVAKEQCASKVKLTLHTSTNLKKLRYMHQKYLRGSNSCRLKPVMHPSSWNENCRLLVDGLFGLSALQLSALFDSALKTCLSYTLRIDRVESPKHMASVSLTTNLQCVCNCKHAFPVAKVPLQVLTSWVPPT